MASSLRMFADTVCGLGLGKASLCLLGLCKGCWAGAPLPSCLGYEVTQFSVAI